MTDTLAQYRKVMQAVMVENIIAMAKDQRWSQEDRAGTVLTALTSAIGASAAVWRETQQHLKHAPVEAVVRDLLDLVAEVICKPKAPNLTVVDGDNK